MELTLQELINDWKQRVNELQKAHYTLAVKHNKYHYGFGLPAILFPALAGIVLLTMADESRLRITIGLVGIIAAVLSAVQTFYSHGKRAENHLFVVSQLVQVRRDVELIERFAPTRKSEKEHRIRAIDERILKFEEDAPARDVTEKTKNWPWILLGLTGAILLLLLLGLGSEWLAGVRASQETAENWHREAVQQGTTTWEFDPRDPLVEQRIILVNTWINEMTTQKVITLLNYLDEKDHEIPITIILSSNGGYTKDAYAIVHAIRESESVVNTVALGDCFSACVKILMSGTGERKMAQTARLAIHTHSYPYDDDPYSKNTILYEREREFFQKYSGIPLDWINNREENFYYISPEQAKTYKIIDVILE